MSGGCYCAWGAPRGGGMGVAGAILSVVIMDAGKHPMSRWVMGGNGVRPMYFAGRRFRRNRRIKTMASQEAAATKKSPVIIKSFIIPL
jgi:hypothetical protein